ncbi:MAG: hypothetical protein Q9167_003164 [Letrouitia subvulpina]
MGRMNYVNRKSAGVKLSHSVAKDLIKRIPPASGSKAAFRDPSVELDVSGKALTHEGFMIVADALTRSIRHNGVRGRVVRLQELHLRDNKLHAGSLRALAGVIRLAAHDLRDLDLSNNDISITTPEECQIWEDFLKSFARCCMLRSLDLSGNPLGPKAFEILTRVYSQEPPIDLPGSEASENGSEYFEVEQGNPKQGFSSLEKEVRDLSVTSDPALIMSEGDSTISARSDLEQGFRDGSKAPEKTVKSSQDIDLLNNCATTMGLRSIPYLVFTGTSMTEICALHLSFMIVCHRPPDQLLEYAPPAKTGLQRQQLLRLGCMAESQGIIYLPNPTIGNVGLKVLELSVAEHEQLLEADLQPDSPMSPNFWGKHQAPRVTDSRPANRSRGMTTLAAKNRQGQHSGAINSLTELERARSRVQVKALRDPGPGSNDLWQTSLKMLRICRSLCSAKSDRTRRADPQTSSIWSRKKHFPGHSDFPPLPTMGTKPFIGYLDPFTPSREAKPFKQTVDLKRKDSPKVKTPSPRPLHALPSPTNPEMSTVQGMVKRQYRTSLPCGFTEQVWCRMVSLAVEADEIMSDEQQLSVLRWALDRNTLAKEIKLRGKSKSAQIWKTLDSMGCLAYPVEGSMYSHPTS